MTAFPLQPRSATEIVDISLRFVRECYAQLTTLTGAALLPYLALLVLVGRDRVTPFAAAPITIVQLLCTAVAEAATIVAVSARYLSDDASVGPALRSTLRRLPAILGASIVRWLLVFIVAMLVAIIPGILAAVLLQSLGSAVLVVVGILVGIIPGIYAAARTFAVVPVLMLEGRGAVEAVSRAWELAKGAVGRIVLTLCIAWVIYFGIAFAVGGVLGVLVGRNSVLGAVLTAVLLVLVYPFIGVVTTLLYYDLRVRREGFDLEMMAKDLGAKQLA